MPMATQSATAQTNKGAQYTRVWTVGEPNKERTEQAGPVTEQMEIEISDISGDRRRYGGPMGEPMKYRPESVIRAYWHSVLCIEESSIMFEPIIITEVNADGL